MYEGTELVILIDTLFLRDSNRNCVRYKPSISKAPLWAAETEADSHCPDYIGLIIEIRYWPVRVIPGFLPDHS